MPFLLTCATTGSGTGTASGAGCGGFVSGGATANIAASPNSGSTFAGWSCVGDGTPLPFSSTSTSNPYALTMPGENVTCTATFNLAALPPPVNASVESSLALALTFVGITAMAGFKKWRNKT